MTEQELNDLDAAVAVAEGWKHLGAIGTNERNPDRPFCLSGGNDWWLSPAGDYVCRLCSSIPSPTRDWTVAGPLAARYGLTIDFEGPSYAIVSAWLTEDYTTAFEDEPLVAICQAIVAIKESHDTVPAPRMSANTMITAAAQALRSYQYGNSSTDLAEELANKLEEWLKWPKP